MADCQSLAFMAVCACRISTFRLAALAYCALNTSICSLLKAGAEVGSEEPCAKPRGTDSTPVNRTIPAAARTDFFFILLISCQKTSQSKIAQSIVRQRDCQRAKESRMVLRDEVKKSANSRRRRRSGCGEGRRQRSRARGW